MLPEFLKSIPIHAYHSFWLVTNSAIVLSLSSWYDLCNPSMIFLVPVMAGHSMKKWCRSSIKFILHKSHIVCSSVCLLSQFSFNVPVLALHSVTHDAVLLYKSCSSLMVCLNFLYIDNVLSSCISFIQSERVIP